MTLAAANINFGDWRHHRHPRRRSMSASLTACFAGGPARPLGFPVPFMLRFAECGLGVHVPTRVAK